MRLATGDATQSKHKAKQCLFSQNKPRIYVYQTELLKLFQLLHGLVMAT